MSVYYITESTRVYQSLPGSTMVCQGLPGKNACVCVSWKPSFPD